MQRFVRESRPFLQEKLAGGSGFPKAFPALDAPVYRPAREAHQARLDDEVIGIVYQGKARAYPTWAAKIHHIINDRWGSEPLLVDS